MTPRFSRLAILALSGTLICASSVAAGEVRPGETQGLGLMGPKIPATLQTVVADPYRAPAAPACETIPAELAALEEALGPDADQPARSRSKVGEWVGGQVRGLIPYRGAIRFLTRAGDKDKALTHAIMAGFARRGFLRGLEANLECGAPIQAVKLPEPEPRALATPVNLTGRLAEPSPQPVAATLVALETDPGR